MMVLRLLARVHPLPMLPCRKSSRPVCWARGDYLQGVADYYSALDAKGDRRGESESGVGDI
ncbi:MAG: hypothetical protein ACLTF6_06665 [Clostridium sp.]